MSNHSAKNLRKCNREIKNVKGRITLQKIRVTFKNLSFIEDSSFFFNYYLFKHGKLLQ